MRNPRVLRSSKSPAATATASAARVNAARVRLPRGIPRATSLTVTPTATSSVAAASSGFVSSAFESTAQRTEQVLRSMAEAGAPEAVPEAAAAAGEEDEVEGMAVASSNWIRTAHEDVRDTTKESSAAFIVAAVAASLCLAVATGMQFF